MILTTLMSVIITIAFSLIMSTNPLSMGILILTLALSSTTMFALMISSWLCFVIFLIYISGMLVLFSYFVSISPNTPLPSIMINISIVTLIPLILLTMSIPNMSPFMNKDNFYLITMYTNNYTTTLVILVMVLLMAMIIVVKLVNMKNGPLRPFNNYV